MKKYTIYMHISPSNKRYIGITNQIVERRWRNGNGYSNNKYFTNAIKKYGWGNFEHIIIAKGLTEDEAKWLEVELIKKLDSTNKSKGYNITLGGEGVNGYKHTEESRKKISEANKGENHHFYGKTGEENPFYGKHHTEETRKKISKMNKGKLHTVETRKKISESLKGEKNHFYGKHHTEETKKKMCENHADYKDEKHPRARSIICLTTNTVFTTIKEGANFYNIKDKGNISNCCKGKRNSCGKYNGEKLVWRYIEIIEL